MQHGCLHSSLVGWHNVLVGEGCQGAVHRVAFGDTVAAIMTGEDRVAGYRLVESGTLMLFELLRREARPGDDRGSGEERKTE